MSRKPWRPHRAWIPAAIVIVVIAWARYGPAATLVAIAAGLGVALYAQWRAR